MKIYILILALCFTGAEIRAQKMNSTDVPVAVKNSLETTLQIKVATWDKEDENYEANFRKDGKKMSVLFNNAGTVLETEVEIIKSELPDNVNETLIQDFSDYKIDEICKITTKGVVTYEVEIEKPGNSFELLFDVQGKLLKKEDKKKTAEGNQ